MKRIITVIAGLCAALLPVLNLRAQDDGVHGMSDGYEWPSDPAVLAKLDAWQDLKFGVLIHWGLYSIPGIVESWNICNEEWITRPKGTTYEGYKQWYWGLSEQFNPVNFAPEQWASVAREAGMKYVIFTTKHHDGYCLFDTQYTDFKVTAGPFKDNPRANTAWWVFDAFRKELFMIGAYFSKPDWHCEWFWNPYYATPSRMPNYRPKTHPDWWQNYIDFTKGQLTEITSDYGPLDILWLDGGWIAGDQVGLDEVLEGARARYPGLISVDRVIKGRNENYQTPERGVPDKQLLHPWESCIPLSNDWGWVRNAPYKSWQKVVCTLAEIVAKGGCFVLGVGPTADGVIEEREVEILQAIGAWLDRNGAAIYATRPTPEYVADQGEGLGKVWFTAAKDGRTRHAIYALPEGAALPQKLSWTGNVPTGRMTLTATGKKVSYKVTGDRVTVTLPKGLPAEPLALSFPVAQ